MKQNYITTANAILLIPDIHYCAHFNSLIQKFRLVMHVMDVADHRKIVVHDMAVINASKIVQRNRRLCEFSAEERSDVME